MIEVVLNPSEITQAYMAGTSRELRAVQFGRRHKYGLPTPEGFDLTDWRRHVEACGTEIAAARGLDRFWMDYPELDHDGDIGSRQPKNQVRSTELPHGGLILHREDRDDLPAVLIIGRIPRFVLAGWMLTGDGKDERWWHEHGPGGSGRPCFLVPQRVLRDVEELLVQDGGMPAPFAWRFRSGRAIQLHVYQRLLDDDFDMGPSPIDKAPTWNPLVEQLSIEDFLP